MQGSRMPCSSSDFVCVLGSGSPKKRVLGGTFGVSRPDVPPSTPPSGTKGDVLGLAPWPLLVFLLL